MTSRQRRILDAIKALELKSPTNEITPRGLWESARAEDHPLHDEFEWDDSAAAESWRDDQARRLLRLRIVVIYEERTINAPICVRTPEIAAGQAGYTRLVSILSDKEKARRLFVEEIERASRALRRAKEVSHAVGLGAECDDILAALTALPKRSSDAA